MKVKIAGQEAKDSRYEAEDKNSLVIYEEGSEPE